MPFETIFKKLFLNFSLKKIKPHPLTVNSKSRLVNSIGISVYLPFNEIYFGQFLP